MLDAAQEACEFMVGASFEEFKINRVARTLIDTDVLSLLDVSKQPLPWEEIHLPTQHPRPVVRRTTSKQSKLGFVIK